MPLSKPDLEKFKQADTQEKIFHQQVNSQFDRYEQQLRDLSTTPNINGAYLEGLTRETARNLYALRDSHKQTVYVSAYHLAENIFGFKPPPARNPLLPQISSFSGQLDPSNPKHQEGFSNILIFLQQKDKDLTKLSDPNHARFILKNYQRPKDMVEHGIDLLDSVSDFIPYINKYSTPLAKKLTFAWQKVRGYVNKNFVADPTYLHKQYLDKWSDSPQEIAKVLADPDFTLTPDLTKLYLEASFNSPHLDKSTAKQLSKNTMDKLSTNLKLYIQKDPAFNQHFKETIAKELAAQGVTQPEALQALSSRMDLMEKDAGQAMQFLADFYGKKKQFTIFDEPWQTEVRDIRKAQGEITGIAQGFYALQTLAAFTKSPELMKVAQTGIGLANVAQQVTNVLAGNAMYKASEIGSAALTGNYIGVGLALLSCVLPFLSQGPSINELTYEYLQKAVKHLDEHLTQHDRRFDHLDETLVHIQKMLSHIMEMLHVVIENDKRLSQQLTNFQASMQLSLETILAHIKGLNLLVNTGFTETLLQDFDSTLRQINDILTQRDPHPERTLPPLMRKLVGDHITRTSNSSFHTGHFLFDKNLFKRLIPQPGEPTFSNLAFIDKTFVTDSLRHQQALRLEPIFERMDENSHGTIGLFAAYAEALLSDELMSKDAIDFEIRQVNDSKNEIQLASKAFRPSGDPAGQMRKKTALALSLTAHTQRLGKLYQMRGMASIAKEKQSVRETARQQNALALDETQQQLSQHITSLTRKAATLDTAIQKNLISQTPP